MLLKSDILPIKISLQCVYERGGLATLMILKRNVELRTGDFNNVYWSEWRRGFKHAQIFLGNCISGCMALKFAPTLPTEGLQKRPVCVVA
jgi:hypothetical protein